MLKEVDQNIVSSTMSSDSNSAPASASRDHMAFHHTNVYKQKFCVTTMAASPGRVFLVARRSWPELESSDRPFSRLDIYDITRKGYPRFIFSIVEYEDITGLAWLDEKRFVSVSVQGIINVYSVSLGVKTKVFTTDYGAITCMSYLYKENLLITGTEYGYAVGYKILNNGNLIERDKKMVKLNEPIYSLDVHIQPRDVPMEVVITEKKKKFKPPSSKKRKKSESSEESDIESDQESKEQINDDFLADYDITVYGMCRNKTVVWDYHKMRILDSIQSEYDVCCVMALKNGNFVTGDSGGMVNVYDNLTFTCRQSTRVMKSPISCLAVNGKNSVILAAGYEPIISLLKSETSEDSKDEYVLFEHFKDHSARVKHALFISKKEFFTCSDDDLIIKFRISRSDGRRTMKRFSIQSNHQSRIQFAPNEVMTLSDESLNIYSIESKFRSDIETYPLRIDLAAPKRKCIVKAYSYIHAATFDSEYICYSNGAGIRIIKRQGLNELGAPSLDLPGCHILKLCQSSRYLVGGQQKKLFIVKLDDTNEDQTSDGSQKVFISSKRGVQEKVISLEEKTRVYQTVSVVKLKGMVRDILYHANGQLIVSCGTTIHFLYIIQLPQTGTSVENPDKISVVHKFKLPTGSLSHLALNQRDTTDPNLYIFTPRNQLIKCDITMKALKTQTAKLIEEGDSVSNMTKDKNVQGIVVLSKSYCLVYDSDCIMKLDVQENEIVNETAKYDNINTVSNTVFERPGEIIIV